MRWSDIPFNPPPRTLRQFALGWLLFWGCLAAWQELMHDHHVVATLCGGVGFLGGALGLACPRWLRPLFVGLMIVTFPLGWVISHAVLALLFFGVFTPLGLAFRLCGRDLLARRPRPEYDSYWQARPAAPDVHAYFRQS